MGKEKTSLANQAVVRLWGMLKHGDKRPLSVQAIAVCDVVDDRLDAMEATIQAVKTKLDRLDKASHGE